MRWRLSGNGRWWGPGGRILRAERACRMWRVITRCWRWTFIEGMEVFRGIGVGVFFGILGCVGTGIFDDVGGCVFAYYWWDGNIIHGEYV